MSSAVLSGSKPGRWRLRQAPIVFRILLVDPEEGLMGVLVLEDDKPTMKVPPTPEEVERVRADLERRRAARPLSKGGAH